MSKANGKRYKNFDAFFNETKRTPLVFTMFGKDWKLPPALPAILMVTIIRAQAEGNDTLHHDVLITLLEGMLGKKQFQELLDSGMDMEQMEAIVNWASEQYNHGVKSEEDSENFQQEK